MLLDAFRNRILSGEYAPGTRLPTISELAAEFQVSKGSIREAMRALQMVGLVRMRQGDGVYVAPAEAEFVSVPLTWGLLLNARTQRELVEVRLILEVAAADLAAHNAGIADHEAMRRAIDRLRDAGTPDAAADADLDFHLAVTRASGNRILTRLLEGIRDLLRPVFVGALAKDDVTRRAATYHEAVLEAIVAGDPHGARTAMSTHLTWAAETWFAGIGS